MTKQHPLTDEICEELSSWQLDILDPHLAHEERSDMRAAADWQLERDAEFFKKILVDSLRIPTATAELMAQDFKKAMRPQQQEES